MIETNVLTELGPETTPPALTIVEQRASEREEEEKQARRLAAAENRPDRPLNAGRSNPATGQSIGYIKVNQIYPMGTGDIRVDNSLDFYRNPRDIQELSDEEVEKLAKDIAENEQLSPIWVRPVQRGWELIAGERRLVAHKLAGQEEILARVFRVPLRRAMEMAIAEETHKKGWSPAAQGRAYSALKKLVQQEVDAVWEHVLELTDNAAWTPESTERIIKILNTEQRDPLVIAVIEKWLRWKNNTRPEKPTVATADLQARTGASSQQMNAMMRLAGIDDPELQEEISKLGTGHSRAVLSLETPRQQRLLMRKIKIQGLSTAQSAVEARKIAGRKSVRERIARVTKSRDKTISLEEAESIAVWDTQTVTYILDLVEERIETAIEKAPEIQADKNWTQLAREATDTRITGLIKQLVALRTSLQG